MESRSFVDNLSGNTLPLFGRWQRGGAGERILVTKSDKVQREFKIVDF